MSSKKIISVVIITHNRKYLLDKCLHNLLSQDLPKKKYELIIIDDGSSDGTKEIVKKIKSDNIKYFYQKNKGYGAARNTGIEKSLGKYVAFTDDDCLVQKDWLRKIINNFKENKNVSAVGGSIITPYKDGLNWSAHILNFSSWMPVGKKKFVNDIPTANIAYKKEDIQNIKFNEHTKLGYEDSLFNLKVIQNNKKILYDPSLIITHLANFKTKEHFLKNQRRYGKSFREQGYIAHGIIGILLVQIKIINLLCPRLILVFLRCIRMKPYLYKALTNFHTLFRGEFERGLEIIKK